MTVAPEPRKPQVFEADDPALVLENDSEHGADSVPPPTITTPNDRAALGEIGHRGVAWGTMLIGALTGAAALGVSAWFARLVSAALVRDDWIGTLTIAFLFIAAVSAAVILLREIGGFFRFAKLSRLKADVTAAISQRDSKRERKAAKRLVALYAARPELAWNLQRFRDHGRDIHDAGELLALAEREILTPLDRKARQIVTRSAKRVAAVTAMSPMVLIAVVYVLVENLRLLRSLAALYGGRPGFIGALRLARMVFTHIVATGGIAMTDDLLGQFLGQDLLRRLSRRLGEGAFNGALTARIGVTALEVIRPVPFLAAKSPRVRDILGEALKPLVGKSGSQAQNPS
jgi:putative membrane protein